MRSIRSKKVVMPVVNLEEFLRSGQFGSAKLGMNQQDVTVLMGEPDQLHKHQYQSGVNVWIYKSTQLWFRNKHVYCIGIYYSNIFELPITSNGFFPTQDTLLSEFVSYLHDTQFNYLIDPNLTFPTQINLSINPNREGTIVTNAIFDSGSLKIDSLTCYISSFR